LEKEADRGFRARILSRHFRNTAAYEIWITFGVSLR